MQQQLQTKDPIKLCNHYVKKQFAGQNNLLSCCSVHSWDVVTTFWGVAHTSVPPLTGMPLSSFEAIAGTCCLFTNSWLSLELPCESVLDKFAMLPLSCCTSSLISSPADPDLEVSCMPLVWVRLSLSCCTLVEFPGTGVGLSANSSQQKYSEFELYMHEHHPGSIILDIKRYSKLCASQLSSVFHAAGSCTMPIILLGTKWNPSFGIIGFSCLSDQMTDYLEQNLIYLSLISKDSLEFFNWNLTNSSTVEDHMQHAKSSSL